MEESVREERGGCGVGGYSEVEIAIGNIATPTSSKLAFATSPRSTQAFATVCNLCGEDLANLSQCLVSEHEAACFRRLVAEEEKGGAGFLVACNLCGLSFQDMCANERWAHEEECLRRFEADGWDSEDDTYPVKLTEAGSKADTLTERLKAHVNGGQGINTHTHTCADEETKSDILPQGQQNEADCNSRDRHSKSVEVVADSDTERNTDLEHTHTHTQDLEYGDSRLDGSKNRRSSTATFIYMYVCIYMYICIYVCVCVCLCVFVCVFDCVFV
jgi:hypothetical protein